MNNYTTKTASLLAAKIKGTKADVTYLNINGTPFSKIVSDNIPETPTENDIWKYAVTTDENGVVTITDDVTVDFSEITTAQRNITKTAAKVIDNKVLDANDAVLMNWDTKNFTNSDNSAMSGIFNGSSGNITEWDSDLSSLTNGNNMFTNSTLQSFNSDLSSLTNGNYMFRGADLQSFNNDLPSLTDGNMIFAESTLESFSSDLSKLKNGFGMFILTPLKSFKGDLPSLTNGSTMFAATALTSWNRDLPSLTNGGGMFRFAPLKSFKGDLPSLTNGNLMFSNTALTSWNSDLPSLTNGNLMFSNTALTSFKGDLSSLTDGGSMFSKNQPRHYGVSCYKMVDGVKTSVTETVVSNGLKSFISNLSSLENGYHMFGGGGEVTYEYTDDDGNEVTDTTIDVAPLDEESIMLIADTIKDIKGLNLTGDNDGQIWLGYDATTITDTTNIFKYCDEIVAKGWTVYLNGSEYTSTDNGSVALIDGESSTTPIPHYYKPVQVADEDIAEYVDANNNYYIIVGGQHVFGDDISTYGMFTSYRHAVQEITTALGLTKYEKPSTETNNN